MDLTDYRRHDAIGLRELITARAVSAAEVETAAREALEVANAAVNGLAIPVFSTALTSSDDGSFGGIPFLIKDVPMAQGVPFSVGSRSMNGVIARHDTDLMRRFRAAGLVTLGVTTMPELGMSFSTESVKHGPTRNPWDLTRGVGGSSGGAAALVATGAVPLAHANDGAGSIRIPASCCGLVGLKPSRGRIPCGPDTGEAAFGMASEFAVTRTVRDTAHLLDAIHGPAVGDKYTAPPPDRPYADELRADPRPLRVAVTTQAWSGAAVDTNVANVTVQVAKTLEQSGHVLTETAPALNWEAVIRAITLEFADVAGPFLLAPHPPDPSRMEAVSRQILADVKARTALEMVDAFAAQNQVTRAVGAFFADYDLLLTPTLGQLPAPHDTLRYDEPGHSAVSWLHTLFDYGPFTAVFNVSGNPAISLPLGRSSTGLPIGVQIVAAYGREDLLIRIAAHLEQAMPWKTCRQPI